MGWVAADAQQAADPNVSAEQQAMLNQLERGERVELSEQPKAETEKTKRESQHTFTMDELFEKYAPHEKFTSVVFGHKMMEMMAERVERDDVELAELLEGIRTIRVISTKEPNAEFERDAMSWQKGLSGGVKISHVVEEGQTSYTYLVDGGRWNESVFVLLSFGAQEQAVIYIKGYFSVKDISRLSMIRPK